MAEAHHDNSPPDESQEAGLSSQADDAAEADAPQPLPASMWQPRRLIVQSIGFIIGVALLIWCIRHALRAGDWEALRETSPWYVLGLAGCSVISLLVNGASFWLLIRPVQPLRFVDLQLVNLTTALLNYAPIRLGLIARVAYHLRVDRMPLLRLGGWMAALAYAMLLSMGAVVAATIVHPHFDLIWLGLILGIIVLGGLLTRALLSHPLVKQHGRGMEQMLQNPVCLWGVLALRLIDIAAFAGRMAFAVAIVPDLTLRASEILLLAITALALSLNPLGRFGFREAGVAVVAGMLVSSQLGVAELEGRMAQLALIESAGEAIVFIPGGILALLWYRHKWRQATHARAPRR